MPPVFQNWQFLGGHLRDFDASLDDKFSIALIKGALALHTSVSQTFRKTAANFHYEFNIRHIANVFQGLLVARPEQFLEPEKFVFLWVHESERVYGDRLVSGSDLEKYNVLAQAACKKAFPNVNVARFYGKEKSDPLVFCHFAANMNDKIYDMISSVDHMSKTLNEALHEYNETNASMDLVLFEDAMRHIARIHRVIKQPRGNLMLVGIGGSGRQSLARLATFIAEYRLFMIEITKNYRSIEFHDDLKALYTEAGCDNKKVTFLFNETQIKEESFLEDLNNILSSGVVPNLFGKDEYGAIFDGVRKDAIKAGIDETPDQLFRFFIDRVRANLHIILCVSPVGEALRVRCRMYPGLVNCTTIDWFHTWPEDALTSVAIKFLSAVKLPEGDVRQNVALLFSHFHLSVINKSTQMRLELKRQNYVTPTHYLELTQGYKTLLDEKRSELGNACARLENGLAKLEDAKEQVTGLVGIVEDKKVVVAAAEGECQELLKVIVVEKQAADAQKAQVEADSERIAKEAEACNAIAADAKADLDVAMPALEKVIEEN